MRIFDLDSWNEVFDTISRNKKRSVFTALGVVWGTFMLIILLGVGNGFALLFKGNVNNLVSNSILIYSGTTSMPWNGLQSGRLIEFDKKDVLLIKCFTCKGKTHVGVDETIVVNPVEEAPENRFAEVERLEAMTEEERFAFWKSELSKCIRCNACRNVCPACSCVKCVFDNPQSGVAAKANDDEFEEQLYHIIRAFHVAGRCTDCGECSRVCPQRIPLHLLNRKFIKDMNACYGEFQAGESAEGRTPLTDYTEKDVEPNNIFSAGVKK